MDRTEPFFSSVRTYCTVRTVQVPVRTLFCRDAVRATLYTGIYRTSTYIPVVRLSCSDELTGTVRMYVYAAQFSTVHAIIIIYVLVPVRYTGTGTPVYVLYV